MTPRICCICLRTGHRAHACPDGAALRAAQPSSALVWLPVAAQVDLELSV